jgi:hypothetical protein
MSFISMNTSFSAVNEQQPVASGRYTVRVVSADPDYVGQTGKSSIKLQLSIDEHDDAPLISHFISLPSEGDDSDKAAFKMLMMKRFLVAFSVPFEDNGFDPAELVGTSATVDVVLGEPDAKGNVYNQLGFLPKLRDEVSGGRKSKK